MHGYGTRVRRLGAAMRRCQWAFCTVCITSDAGNIAGEYSAPICSSSCAFLSSDEPSMRAIEVKKYIESENCHGL